MKAVFADTFYWIALTVPRDAGYGEAQAIGDSVVTTEEVLTEYLTYFSRGSQHFRLKAAATVRGILQDPTVRVILQTHATFLAAVELYKRAAGQGL